VPILTRILTVCDAFDTLAGVEGTPPGRAVEQLRDGAGERYCPAVVEALTAVLESGLHEVVDEPPGAGGAGGQAGPAAR
jgi:HD-GYP domain-containing protein (c-di-GMP phosphodiesterase class II)